MYFFFSYAQALIYSLAQCKIDKCLVKPLNFAHGGLDVEGLDVLPVLLQQGDEEVHGEMDILDKIVLSHTHVANSNRQAEHLKQTMQKPFDAKQYEIAKIATIITIISERKSTLVFRELGIACLHHRGQEK